MGVIDEALTDALTAALPRPSDTQLLDGRETREALSRAEAGIPGTGPLPRRGTGQRRTYDTAMRRFQRYTTNASETREAKGSWLNRLRDGVTRVLALPNVAIARLSGVDMQLTASIRVSKSWKVHRMPVGAPQHVEGRLLGPTLDAWVRDDMAAAGAELLAAFYTAYWGDPQPCETGDIDACTVAL